MPTFLDPGVGSALRVKIDYDPGGTSGAVYLWNSQHAARVDEDIKDGGNRIMPDVEYTLDELNYNPAGGYIAIFAETIMVFNGHATKKDVVDYGKPDDRINAILLVNGTRFHSDEVKYMAVLPDTFYPNLQNREELRNAMASEKTYTFADGPEYALKVLGDDKLSELGVPIEIIGLIGAPPSVPGFKNAIYLDHVSGKYVVAFAGTNDRADIMADIWQGLGQFTLQYNKAIEIGRKLKDLVDFRSNTVVTGHSLGGGLASAASVVSGFHADTFNAAGLLQSTLPYDEDGNSIPSDPDEVWRYDNAANGLINAYFLDWDLLSFAQDNTPLIGYRVPMDGPVDAEIGLLGAALAFQVITGAFSGGLGWLSVLGSLGGIGYQMGLAHTTHYYQYGLMVNESTGWDIYGYEF